MKHPMAALALVVVCSVQAVAAQVIWGAVSQADISSRSSEAARTTGKRAWEWSDEERVAVRFDPASVRERAAAHAAAQAARGPTGPTQPSVHSQSSGQLPVQQYVVDGSRDPALLLPYELIDPLLKGLHSDAKFRTPARLALAKGIREMGYSEDDFWNRLQRLSAPYLALSSRPANISIQRATRCHAVV